MESYRYLPLASLIEEKVLVLHGGLFSIEDVELADLREYALFPLNYLGSIERWTCLLLESEKDIRNYSKIYCGVIPKRSKEYPRVQEVQESTLGGTSVKISSPETVRHVDESIILQDLSLLIRSHEKEEEGYTWHHGKKVITIFSASYYCGTNDNKVTRRVATSHASFLSRDLERENSHAIVANLPT